MLCDKTKGNTVTNLTTRHSEHYFHKLLLLLTENNLTTCYANLSSN